MTNRDKENTEIPRGVQSALLALAGSSLGILVALTIIAATTTELVTALSVYPWLKSAGIVGGVIGLLLGLNHKQKD